MQLLIVMDMVANKKKMGEQQEVDTRPNVEYRKKDDYPNEQLWTTGRAYKIFVPRIYSYGVPLRHIVLQRGQIPNSQTFTFNSQVKNSAEFVQILDGIEIDANDIMVSFDVASLFTSVPVRDTLTLFEKLLSVDVTNLYKHVLTTTYFQYDEEYYEQVDRVVMVSPAIANFYMENFEGRALREVPLKPKYFCRHVDDTFVIRPHETFLL